MALSDLTNLEALDYARGRLNRLGVDRALVRAGVRDGDTVRIGCFAFDYAEDDVVSREPPLGRPLTAVATVSRVVAKIGTSSMTDEDGRIDVGAIARLCDEAAKLRADGHERADRVVGGGGSRHAGARPAPSGPGTPSRCRPSRPWARAG